MQKRGTGTEGDFPILAPPPPQENTRIVVKEERRERDNHFGGSVGTLCLSLSTCPYPAKGAWYSLLTSSQMKDVSRELLGELGLYPFRVLEVQGLMQAPYSKKSLGKKLTKAAYSVI